jgi:hypothetical protein
MTFHKNIPYSLNVSDRVLDPYNTDKIMVFCIIIFKLMCSRRENKFSELNGSKYFLNLIFFHILTAFVSLSLSAVFY